jgi:hypothetical protein
MEFKQFLSKFTCGLCTLITKNFECEENVWTPSRFHLIGGSAGVAAAN